jgi:5-methylcytosine-specific restriction enzyme B
VGKQDPTRTDLSVPEAVRKAWPYYKSVFDRYGKEMYALYCPTANRAGTEAALTAFLDLHFEERGHHPLASSQEGYQSVQAGWF